MAKIRGLKFTKIKGGPASGHHGHAGNPPSVGGSVPSSSAAGGHPSGDIMKLAGQAAGSSPDELKKLGTNVVLASWGASLDLRAQYHGVKGKGERRRELDGRLKILRVELHRRGVKSPMDTIKEKWPEWNPAAGKVTFKELEVG